MRYPMILILCISCIKGISQDTSFTFTREGFTDFVVKSIEGKSQADLYKKTLDWVSFTYNTPAEVIKAKIENEYIRIEGSTKEIWCIKIMGLSCYDIRYLVEISFKDGKYKFDVIGMRNYVEQGGWKDVDIPTPNSTDKRLLDNFFSKDGEPKKTYRPIVENMPAYFNKLNQSLANFITNNEQSKKSDW